MRSFALIVIFIFISVPTFANQLSDEQIKNILIKESVSNYLANIGNCPCPYNTDRIGRSCGKRSAWSKPGGKAPLCYSSDITSGMVLDYREKNKMNNADSILPIQPHESQSTQMLPNKPSTEINQPAAFKQPGSEETGDKGAFTTK